MKLGFTITHLNQKRDPNNELNEIKNGSEKGEDRIKLKK